MYTFLLGVMYKVVGGYPTVFKMPPEGAYVKYLRGGPQTVIIRDRFDSARFRNRDIAGFIS